MIYQEDRRRICARDMPGDMRGVRPHSNKQYKVMNMFYQNDQSDSRCGRDTRVVLNASTGGAGPLPIITTLLADPIPVVSVTINTSKFREPDILLHFTGIVSLPIGISVTLNFQIYRSTGNGYTPVGPTFTFATLVDVLEAESFAFQYFDSGIAPDDYTYTVMLSTNSIVDITPGVTIGNATLSALAVDAD
jgi:hypothetical protein